MPSISLITNTRPLSEVTHKKASGQQFSEAQGAAISSANNSAIVSISTTARSLASEAKPIAPASNTCTVTFETDHGSLNLSIDDYFSPGTNAVPVDITAVPLLLPTPGNIAALSKHISAKIPQFLAQNNIPSAPSSITYDNEGKIQLPQDYRYATEFKQALEKNPTIAREISTVSALTSHLVELKKLIPFQEEFARASTQTAANAVVAKYSFLFSGNQHHDTITLHFSENGSLSITADGKLVS